MATDQATSASGKTFDDVVAIARRHAERAGATVDSPASLYAGVRDMATQAGLLASEERLRGDRAGELAVLGGFLATLRVALDGGLALAPGLFAPAPGVAAGDGLDRGIARVLGTPGFPGHRVATPDQLVGAIRGLGDSLERMLLLGRASGLSPAATAAACRAAAECAGALARVAADNLGLYAGPAVAADDDDRGPADPADDDEEEASPPLTLDDAVKAVLGPRRPTRRGETVVVTGQEIYDIAVLRGDVVPSAGQRVVGGEGRVTLGDEGYEVQGRVFRSEAGR